MTRGLTSRILFSAALLPMAGLALLLPYLWSYPIYPDEQQWKLISSRLLIDGKLIYLFPACGRGFLLDPPLSSYPQRWLDAALYVDASDPHRLRAAAIAIFIMLSFYFSWFLWRVSARRIPFTVSLGSVTAALTLGTLPFLEVLNRPEQEIVVLVTVACTLPALLSEMERTTWVAWAFAGVYAFLACLLLANHIKALFFLPAVMISGYFIIRRLLPFTLSTAVAGLASYETYRFWQTRTDCPESQFLTDIFRSLSVSPIDLQHGVRPFLYRLFINLDVTPYWESVKFQNRYQADWLPATPEAITPIEYAINTIIPLVVFFAIVFVVSVFSRSIFVCCIRRGAPSKEILIAILLVAALGVLTLFQGVKNFYEASLQVPVILLALILVIPEALKIRVPKYPIAFLTFALFTISTSSHAALAWRFSTALTGWRAAAAILPKRQAALVDLLDQCGIDTGSGSSRVAMDDFAYTVLWRAREPIVLPYLEGWWATGTDPLKLIKGRKISALVGACYALPQAYRARALTNQYGDCCVKLDAVD